MFSQYIVLFIQIYGLSAIKCLEHDSAPILPSNTATASAALTATTQSSIADLSLDTTKYTSLEQVKEALDSAIQKYTPVGNGELPFDEISKQQFDLNSWNQSDYAWARSNKFAKAKLGAHGYCPFCPRVRRPSQMNQRFIMIPEVGYRTCQDLFFEGRLKNFNNNLCGITMDRANACCPTTSTKEEIFTPASEKIEFNYDSLTIPEEGRIFFNFTSWTDKDYKLAIGNIRASEPMGTGEYCDFCPGITRPSEISFGIFGTSTCVDLFFEGKKKLFSKTFCKERFARANSVCCKKRTT